MAKTQAAMDAVLVLVEDDQVDVEAVRRALRRHPHNYELWVVNDGEQGEQCVRSLVREGLEPFVVLDLQMPRVNGLELLRRIRSDPELKEIPVSVWTTSDAERDRSAVQSAGITSYHVKSDADCIQELLAQADAHFANDP